MTREVLKNNVPADVRIVVALSRQQKFDIAIAALIERGGHTFPVLFDVDHMPEAMLRKMPTMGTFFDPVVVAWSEAGLLVHHTFGDVMDELELTKDQMHDAFCFCMMKREALSGDEAAFNLQQLQRPADIR